MRAVIQRVKQASVTVRGEVTGEIAGGLLVFLGIEHADGEDDVNWLAGKLARLRIFNDAQGNMNLSLVEIGGEMLVVSQFTLHSSTKNGNRPSYARAAESCLAKAVYEQLAGKVSELLGKEVQVGRFGEHMEVTLLNDGPVTIFIDSKNRE